MSEPVPEPIPEPLLQEPQAGAPAWGKMAIGAGLLAAAAVILPLVLHDDPPTPPIHPPAAAAPPSAPPTGVAPAPLVVRPDEDRTAAAPPPTSAPRVVQGPVPLSAQPEAVQPLPLAPPLPQPLPQPQAVSNTQACALRVPNAARDEGGGIVTAFEDRATSVARIDLNQKLNGGPIDPNYVGNLRVMIHMDSGGYRIHLAPPAMAVRIGDRVTGQDVYRSPGLPCNYVPPLITADLGPASAANTRTGAPP